MEKSTLPERYLTSDGSKIVPAPFFLYEVSTYKIFTREGSKPSIGRVECWSSKFFKSSKPLQIKSKTIKKKDYLLEQSILWIAAPIDYIKDNHLEIYNPKKKKNEKRSSNVRKRKLH